jgi:hypothetical protein
MILPAIRDKRFITIRRGGVLTDDDHHLLALWAAECAEHVLSVFEEVRPNDDRPRRAVDATRAWVVGRIKMSESKEFAGASQNAAREMKGVSEAARMAALSAGQAAVAAHELGAAAYAICAVMKSVPKLEREAARIKERDWQRGRLPERIWDLVLDDQRLRNDICWFVFSEEGKG